MNYVLFKTVRRCTVFGLKLFEVAGINGPLIILVYMKKPENFVRIAGVENGVNSS